MSFTLARRTGRMNASAIREILKLTERPGVLSLAGGLPSPESFPLEAIRRASDDVLATQAEAALQYAASEGLPALRAWIARRLATRGCDVHPNQVLITTGSQQALDLLGKVMLDDGATVLAEQPTYLGVLQAFAPYEARIEPWPADERGPLPEALPLSASASPPRLAYLVPNFQNPTGACLDADRRQALARALASSDTLVVEDDPYGELWFDTPPPLPLAALAPRQVVYLGSFSKVLAPGLRVGYLVTPPHDRPEARALHAKLLQAKQAADLHTPGLNQRIVMTLLDAGFDLDAHLDGVRARYRSQRDAMAGALARHLPQGCHWRSPPGGMFFWVRAPGHVDTFERLEQAVARGVAYVPGAAFYSSPGDGTRASCVPAHTLRLSFVTLSPEQIDEAVGRLAACLA